MALSLFTVMTNGPSPPHDPAPPTAIPFWVAFRYWLTLGFINFGGPAGQIALMHRDLVEHRRWISETRFLHALNFCMLLPGPEAQQLAIYIGWLLHGRWGGIVAGIFFILPSMFVLLGASYIYAVYGSVPWMEGLFTGIKPVIVAIVAEAGLKIGKRALARPLHFWMAGAAFFAIFFIHVPFPLIVVAAGLVGWVVARADSEFFPLSEMTQVEDTGEKDNREIGVSETTRHFLQPFRRIILAVFLGLWLVPFLLLLMLSGPGSLFSHIYLFFFTGSFCHVWRGLCRIGLCQSICRGILWMAHT